MTSTVPGADQVGPPPPFDPELAAALAELRQRMPASFTADMIPVLRAGSREQRLELADLRMDGRFEVEERAVPGPAGAPDVTLLICRPVAAAAPGGVLYFIHGGGMIMGDHRGRNTGEAATWAAELGLGMVSVDYRLAPENPYPAPVEDCYAGLLWTVGHAAELGFDPGRVVIAGVSAGGGLAAATALLARDRGGPALAGQMLLCPMLDDRNDSVSARQMAGLGIWDQGSNALGWTALLGDARGGPGVSPYAAPARAGDLSGLPPAYLDVGSAETFRDETIDYATRIWRAGGQAELHVWPGGFHGFDGFAPQTSLSQTAKTPRVPWLRRLLATAG
ncbi:alpha/beta hydrolase [Amycolatopsis acidiphila]|uniref:Alpha/beta hydrolase n=1 Tax=Amycolatopsis acidiphila TaxID=715473 RepID=A0A558ADD5_9PSEU|nr:alpha/beta hydrolase [Amycolatopsis acidiphila]TVT22266.1 alpha/beta hydrolase [Amycolatopsis acidiphila]UIJ58020.1 alpha/beta hydrolase [Amycolatopsis acidiphila]GHG70545.1 esterase [Amycolatopsis acidiphila]